MKKILFGWSIIISVLAVIICGVVSSTIVYNMAYNEELGDLIYSLDSILDEYDLSLRPLSIADELSDFIEDLAVTILDTDGIVVDQALNDLYFSSYDELIPDFQTADKSGIVVWKKWSESVNRRILSVSKKDFYGNVVILSKPIITLNDVFKNTYLAVVLGVIAALLFSWIITRIVVNKILAPIHTIQQTLANMLAYKVTYAIPPSGYDELDYITESINRLSGDINEYVELVKNQKDRYEFLLDNIDQGVVLLDSQMLVLNANTAAIRLLHCNYDIIGRSFVSIVRKNEMLKLLDAVYEKGTIATLDFDHNNTVLSLTLFPTIFKDSGNKGAIVNILDVTSIRKTEQMKAEFIANASHELKTPVTSIKGFSDLLCSGMIIDEEKIHDYNRRINHESERMMSLIEDTLLLANLESYPEPQKEVVHLTKTIKNVVDSLDMQIKEKGLFVSIPKEEIFMEINQHDIVSILTNLIENAVKYNVQGGEILIEVEKSADKMTLSVKDTGIGISPELQDRVFERFYRIDKSRSRKGGGTGLGLAIVKHAVLRNGGTISLESKVGFGTTIKMTF